MTAFPSDFLLCVSVRRFPFLLFWKIRAPDIFHKRPAFTTQEHSSNSVEDDDASNHQTNLPIYFSRITRHCLLTGLEYFKTSITLERQYSKAPENYKLITQLVSERELSQILPLKIVHVRDFLKQENVHLYQKYR